MSKIAAIQSGPNGGFEGHGIGWIEGVAIILTVHQPSSAMWQAFDNLMLIAPGGRVASGKVGTRGYWAPEVVRREPYGAAVDFWCLGVTLYCLWSEAAPFNVDHAARAGALGADPPPPPAERDARKALQDRLVLEHEPPTPAAGVLSADAVDFWRRLQSKDPAARLGARGGAAELMDHPFFTRAEPPTCWESMRAGSAAAPMRDEIDVGVINASSIAALGEAAAPAADGAALGDEHHKLFAAWEYVDERRLEAEVLSAARRSEEVRRGGGGEELVGVWGDLWRMASGCATSVAWACCVETGSGPSE